MDSYKKNSIISLAYLFFQSGYSAILGLVANVIITILAAKEMFGIYSATLATISIFNYLSDIGLAGALIQKKDISDEDLKTVFTVQQSIILALVTIGFTSTSWVLNFFKLGHNAEFLYWAVLLSFFISSLKTIPSVLLEREIRFNDIVKVQIIESTLFYSAVSICIILNLGLLSFAYSMLLRSIVGTGMLYYLRPWRPKVGLHRQSLKDLLSFGIPFQSNSLLALVKDDLMIIFLGKMIGFSALGEIMWAKKWAEAPIRIIMDNVSKILFPLVSRLQEKGESMRKTVVATIWIQFAVLAPILALSAFLMPYIVAWIPKYSKWASALPIFYIFCFASLFSTLSTPILNVFNALKKPKVPLSFMVFWTVMTWALSPIAVKTYGPIGFAYTQLALSTTFIPILLLMKHILKIEIFSLDIPKRAIYEVFVEIRKQISKR